MAEILAQSLSGEFVAYDNGFDEICISRNDYMLYAIATIKGNQIIGIIGNTGNRFDRLSAAEKADCATLLIKLQNKSLE